MNAPVLKRVFGESNARCIGRAFDLMEIAEEEIAAAKRRTCNRGVQSRIHEVFRSAQPGILLGFDNDDLYRGHVRELCERARLDEDLRPGTKAECIVALHGASLKAPLDRDAVALYETCFRDVFGATVDGREPGTGSWDGAVAKLLATLRRKLSCEERAASSRA